MFRLDRLAIQWRTLVILLETSKGELTPEIEEVRNSLITASEDSVLSLREVYLHLSDEKMVVKNEADRLSAKVKEIDRQMATVKKLLVGVMNLLFPNHRMMPSKSPKTVKGDLGSVTLTTTPIKVVIDKADNIPDTYKSVKLEMSVDYYNKIKNSIDADQVTVGAVEIKLTPLCDIFKSANVAFDGVRYLSEDSVRIS